MKKCYINTIAAIHPNGVIAEDGMLHACEPDYKSIITNANQRRRMSHIVRMGVACGLDCISQNPNAYIGAIITATGLGCLADTEKFLNIISDNNEQLLNPTAFIQSTFNTIGAQIALICKNHSYNNTYVHRGLSFESALIDSLMWVWRHNSNVLVGAADEVTESSHIILKRLGLLNNVTLGEGAQFFILGSEKQDNTYAELKAVKTFTKTFTKDELTIKITDFLKENSLNINDVNYLITGKNGHKKQDIIYNDVENLFSNASCSTFKDICGEYQTASSFALWKAAQTMKENSDIQNLLIYNHYNSINHSLILLKKC